MESFNLQSKEFKQLLLFLGEGNFSFSKSVALSPEFSTSSCHLIASDFIPDHKLELELDELGNPLTIETEEEGLITEEKKVQSESFNTSLLKKNVSLLKSKGYTVLLGVDATKIHDHETITKFCSDEHVTRICVVFNFPHVKSKKMKIGLNRDLLRDFFISCDKLWHQFNSKSGKEEEVEVEIIPVVSLCAGQSGIPEVESVERKWGDSWQVNEMAAQGNFVCTCIQKFGEWSLAKLCLSLDTSFPGESQQLYQSSYYRLQTGVSFTTNNALTFQYQHRKHIDPLQCDWLQSMFKFTSSVCRDEMFEDFLQTFSPVTDERIISTINAEKESDKKCNAYRERPYIHTVSCFSTETECFAKIKDYLNIQSSELELYLEDGDITMKTVFVRTTGKNSKEKVEVSVGESCPTDQTRMTLFVDRLLEFKHGADYRLLSSDTLSFYNKTSTSLFPHFHEFHISFWISPKFSFQSFLEVLLNVYGLILKSVEFVEEYDDNKGRKSICWKIQVQSLDYALSRIKAHEMYLQLRSQLSDKLEVEVR